MSKPLHPNDPQQLGDYRIIGRLGRGGMGTVYLAEGRSGERTAIKVINSGLADDDMFRDRFRREVKSACSVRRFCTAPVLDAQLDGEPLFVVTEFVDGPNLDEFVRQSGPMRGSSLEHLAVGVATALTAIHGAGVIHRDLKPANVLLSSVGPRVIDFGLARALDTHSGATRTGQLIGTPAYMAPELISGGTASPASDVFAWGCVVAFAGTGRAPFDGEVIPAVIYQISHGEPSLDGLDEGVRHLVTRALDKDPAQRPSAQELLDLLTGRPHATTPAKHAPPPKGGPDTAPLRSSRTPGGGRPSRRRRRRVKAVAVLAGIATVLVAISSAAEITDHLPHWIDWIAPQRPVHSPKRIVAQGAIRGPGTDAKCVDVANNTNTSGNAVQLWDCNDVRGQQWSLMADGTLRSYDKCLDIVENAIDNRSKVQLWDCNGASGQQWVPRADGSLFNPHSGRCLDDPAGATTNRTRLQIYDCNRLPAQVWKIAAGRLPAPQRRRQAHAAAHSSGHRAAG